MRQLMKPHAKRGLVTAAVLLSAVIGTGTVAFAEGELDVSTAEAIPATLQKQVGKRVAIKLTSGQELEGTVAKVGPAAVHLSQLAGKEFFDAVVRLDQVSAVIVRTKTK